jgi:hypothetical protein
MKQPKPTPRRVSPEPTAGGSRKSGFPLLPAALFLVGVSLLIWLIAGSFRLPPGDQQVASTAAALAADADAGDVEFAVGLGTEREFAVAENQQPGPGLGGGGEEAAAVKCGFHDGKGGAGWQW